MEKELKMKSNYFKKPFSIVGPYIKDGNRNVCFTIICDEQLAQSIVHKLAGVSKTKCNVRKKMDCILIDDVIVLKTRGWGYLIGTLKLTPQQGIEEQEKLMNFVVNKLKE